MKKILLLALILTLGMILCAVPAYADISADVEAGQAMTREELAEKAMAESGTFVVYGNTSRIATAAENFAALYGISVESNNLKDQEIYTKLRSENGRGAADMVMIQDGAQLSDAIDEGLVVNFVPASVKDVLEESDRQPALVHQYLNKLFIYNNQGDSVPAIRNVWELTAPEMKGNVIFKNPETEKVNMNFLIMCTEPAWAEKLAEAYRDWKGTDIDPGSFENAGYKWVAEFLDNVTFGKSDTSIAEELSQKTAAGKIGLFVLSKLRSSSVLTENLTVAQYDASANGYAIEPFSGFMYPMYTMVNTKATRPYTAMLFIEYLMSQEGFAPWGKSIGSYSPNPAFTVNEGDLSIDVWKANLVMEDANYILDSFEVEDFILQHCQK
ncbi:MAG: extracellular solute-binding protein [Oscillospiraceae bacterium]|nr:extracellular solute-binding protein [Oscillospiraceae bacterium]